MGENYAERVNLMSESNPLQRSLLTGMPRPSTARAVCLGASRTEALGFPHSVTDIFMRTDEMRDLCGQVTLLSNHTICLPRVPAPGLDCLVS